MQQREENSQRQLRDCDWIIARHEIQMTDKCLGRGGWGSVYEGVYCGCAVAVKQIHDLILSPHNIRLFNREMEIASKCHHPHLLQFIGATNDEESPLFVTELMENNLRTLLEQRQLSEREIRAISPDVARGFNYICIIKNQYPSFTGISAVPTCCYGDRMTNGEAKRQIMALLISCNRT